MTPVEIHQGDSPIVLGLPHTGTYIPAEIHADLNPIGQEISDTDWHIHTLYDGLLAGATTVRATFHRYVIDANRDPSGQSLYPGQNTTGLVPLTDFDGQNIWNTPPTLEQIEHRREAYHAPYHAALKAEVDRVKAIHGVAILYDCHSIRSNIPFLFDGTLPDLNIGTNNDTTCSRNLTLTTQNICEETMNYTSILNGRFKGGWTTRHYGKPAENIHAIQMELAQSTYLFDESKPWTYDETKANNLRPHLSKILHSLAAMAPTLGGKS